MEPRKIKDGVYWAGTVDWDRRLFDSLIPLPDGTTYNAYIVTGSEKTALIDTVDPSKGAEFLAGLSGLERIDYIVSQHSEQDHSGVIPGVLERFPEARVVASPKGRSLLVEHLRIPETAIDAVEDGDTITLGGKTLEFMHTPWVHWPETMCTYLREDKILFTCDLFGSHLATSDIYCDDHFRVCEASKRYYAEVMMPFRALIRKHMERFGKYPIEMIAPSHGPVHRDPACIIESHLDWVSDRLSNKAAVAYATMHGSTEQLVDRLTGALRREGVEVERFNLAFADTGRFAMALVDSATIVMGSPVVLTGAHPLVISAAFLANALRPKARFASIIGSYGWAGRMVEQVSATMAGLKLEMIEPVLVKGRPSEEDFLALDRLASTIAAKHREIKAAPEPVHV